jgi:hypothetical protein
MGGPAARSIATMILFAVVTHIGAAQASRQSGSAAGFDGRDGSPAASLRCAASAVEPCFTRHARLSSQNGVAFTLWLTGTTRMLAVDNGMDGVPEVAKPFLEMTSPDHSYLFGDFTVCPLERDRPGHMRSVCVSAAAKLAVQPLDGSRPAFRLASTW